MFLLIQFWNRVADIYKLSMLQPPTPPSSSIYERLLVPYNERVTYNGDKQEAYVVVPVGKDNHQSVAEVVKVEFFAEEDVPLPIEKTKHIIRKCTDDDFEPPEVK